METIKESRAFEQALTQYEKALLALLSDPEREETNKSLWKALEASYQAAHQALTAAIDAHCLHQIAVALVGQAAPVETKLETKSETAPVSITTAIEDAYLQQALADFTETAEKMAGHAVTSRAWKVYSEQHNAVWDRVNAAINAFAHRLISHQASPTQSREERRR